MEKVLGEFLHFRVHTDELEVQELVTFLHEQSEVHFIVKEFGKSNREHVHACIKLKCPKQTFVDRMKRKFSVIKGNGYYSLKQIKTDYDRNARYCYKGKANDYPDIVYTIHTKEEWMAYYNAYWKEYTELHRPLTVTPVVEGKKVRSRTFMVKLCDKVFEEYPVLPRAIWSYYGWKNDEHCPTDLDTLQKCQDYLAELLYSELGNAVKNIDDFIFERMYRGLYAGIIVRCPEKLFAEDSKKLLNKFRHKL